MAEIGVTGALFGGGGGDGICHPQVVYLLLGKKVSTFDFSQILSNAYVVLTIFGCWQNSTKTLPLPGGWVELYMAPP